MNDQDFGNSALKDALNDRMSKIVVIQPSASPAPSPAPSASPEDPIQNDEIDRRENVRKRIQIGEPAAAEYNAGTLQNRGKPALDNMEDDAKRLEDQEMVTKPNRFYKR